MLHPCQLVSVPKSVTVNEINFRISLRVCPCARGISPSLAQRLAKGSLSRWKIQATPPTKSIDWGNVFQLDSCGSQCHWLATSCNPCALDDRVSRKTDSRALDLKEGSKSEDHNDGLCALIRFLPPLKHSKHVPKLSTSSLSPLYACNLSSLANCDCD